MTLRQAAIASKDPSFKFNVKVDVLEIDSVTLGGWDPDNKPPGMRADGSSYWRPTMTSTHVYASDAGINVLDAKVAGKDYYEPDFKELASLFSALWGVSSAKALAEDIGVSCSHQWPVLLCTEDMAVGFYGSGEGSSQEDDLPSDPRLFRPHGLPLPQRGRGRDDYLIYLARHHWIIDLMGATAW